jgi:xanthine dehydrogenase YagR molybdenum-binding subunit
VTAVGTPVTRVEGAAKVTGTARYSAEISLPGMTHLAVVGATVACGRVSAIDADAARAAEGVVAVLTHEDLPRIAAEPRLLPSLVGGAAPGESFFPMQDVVVHYAGQPVALVVAEEYEQAQYAASLVQVAYVSTPPVATIEQGRDRAYEPERLFGGLLPARTERGDVDTALARADVRVEAGYRMAANHHNPLEAPSTVAVWEGGPPSRRWPSCSACRSPTSGSSRTSSAAGSAPRRWCGRTSRSPRWPPGSSDGR